MSSTPKKLAAEFIGTFWLVLGGCGSAVMAVWGSDSLAFRWRLV
jgi:aquaporin Z